MGDALEVLKIFPEESVDCIVTDPPYQLTSTCKSRLDQTKEGSYGRQVPFSRQQSRIKGFMGKEWDVLPPVEAWKECLRVLKSGAFAFIMSSPRLDSLSQMAVRLGEAGFEIGFTPLFHAYASGFPKSENIATNIKKQIAKSISDTIWQRINNSNDALIVEGLLKRLRTAVGIPTEKRNIVADNVSENIKEIRLSSHATIAETQYTDALPKGKITTIALVNAELWQRLEKSNAVTVENPSEDQTALSKQLTFVPTNVPASLCEKITQIIKEEEIQRIWLGKTQFSRKMDTIAKCAGLIEDWKQTILSQLTSDPTLDLMYQTGELCATNVIITKSITDNLILNMGDIPEATLLQGSFAGWQPKPSVEVIIVAMKPLNAKSFVDQALKNAKGCT